MVATLEYKRAEPVEAQTYASPLCCTYSDTLVTVKVHTPEPSEAHKNQYVAFANNPVNLVDPDGRAALLPGGNFGGGDGFSMNVEHGVLYNSAVNSITAGPNEFGDPGYGIFDVVADAGALTAYSGAAVGAGYCAYVAWPYAVAGGTAVATRANDLYYQFLAWQPGAVLNEMILYYPQSPPARATMAEMLYSFGPYAGHFASGFAPGTGPGGPFANGGQARAWGMGWGSWQLYEQMNSPYMQDK